MEKGGEDEDPKYSVFKLTNFSNILTRKLLGREFSRRLKRKSFQINHKNILPILIPQNLLTVHTIIDVVKTFT